MKAEFDDTGLRFTLDELRAVFPTIHKLPRVVQARYLDGECDAALRSGERLYVGDMLMRKRSLFEFFARFNTTTVGNLAAIVERDTDVNDATIAAWILEDFARWRESFLFRLRSIWMLPESIIDRRMGSDDGA